MSGTNDIKERLAEIAKMAADEIHRNAAEDSASCETADWAVVVEELLDHIAALEAENAKLQATVGKLPKCWRLNDDGELVQDVPVTNGKTLWHTHSEDGIAGPHPIVVYGQTADGYWLLSDGKTNFTLYSTYEAAEAAREAEGGE